MVSAGGGGKGGPEAGQLGLEHQWTFLWGRWGQGLWPGNKEGVPGCVQKAQQICRSLQVLWELGPMGRGQDISYFEVIKTHECSSAQKRSLGP